MTDQRKAAPAVDQAARFAEVARAIGADEDEAAFRAKLTLIARQQPKDDAPEPPVEQPTKPKRKRR